ncbi:MAG TPA: hypothetical protein VGQ57_00025 [Polyangiaceae bacterium]|nr:hypothetical protein [Polyangiaceae bacterium]
MSAPSELAARPRRRRSPFGEDLRIVILGLWGFLLQCLKSWQSRL